MAAKTPPAAIVVFGASGDLTSRKLVPALARLCADGLLCEGTSLVGVARSELGDDGFRQRLSEAAGDASTPAWQEVVASSRYVAGDYGDASTFARLAEVVEELDRTGGTAGNRLHYLATPPSVFSTVADGLAEVGLHQPGSSGDGAFSRLVIEKPFGTDLASALALDQALHARWDERQLYRIDHYLGKGTVQNILALRFANAIFEPIWDRRYVDHVEITVAESLGVGHRGGYYDSSGALRDIVQNHALQVLALAAMEPPSSMDAEGIRDEKVKLLRAVDLTPSEVVNDVVRGQYDAGEVDGEALPGYRESEGVDPESRTETFVAMRLDVDSWRWSGVPFYLRTGKALPARVTEVAFQFKDVPHLPFRPQDARGLGRNTLVLRIQPDEGISLCFGAKVPGPSFQVRTVSMDFSYAEQFSERLPDAYERLLHDALMGDPTLFIRSDEVEQAWRIVDPVQQAWAADDAPLERYAAGTWGPKAAHRLLERDGRRWRQPTP